MEKTLEIFPSVSPRSTEGRHTTFCSFQVLVSPVHQQHLDTADVIQAIRDTSQTVKRVDL